MKPTIVMQSDFGVNSGLVACMHGMCKLVDSELITCDITHLLRLVRSKRHRTVFSIRCLTGRRERYLSLW